MIIAIRIHIMTDSLHSHRQMSRGEHVVAEEDLMKEATVMALIDDHPNICTLIGVVTRGEPKLVLVSLCSQGSLLSVLQKQGRTLSKFTSQVLLDTSLVRAHEIASGMAHLSERHHIIHRDLATRNVLVDSMGPVENRSYLVQFLVTTECA